MCNEILELERLTKSRLREQQPLVVRFLMNKDEPLPTRASLLNRLKDAGDGASWEQFHRTYRGLIVGVARRAGLNEHEAEEAVQDTLIAVAKKMPEFRSEPGKDSFKGWLLRIVRWKISDQFRRWGKFLQNSEEVLSSDDRACEGSGNIGEDRCPSGKAHDPSDPAASLDAIWDAEWERHLMTLALDRIKRRARPER